MENKELVPKLVEKVEKEVKIPKVIAKIPIATKQIPKVVAETPTVTTKTPTTETSAILEPEVKDTESKEKEKGLGTQFKELAGSATKRLKHLGNIQNRKTVLSGIALLLTFIFWTVIQTALFKVFYSC